MKTSETVLDRPEFSHTLIFTFLPPKLIFLVMSTESFEISFRVASVLCTLPDASSTAFSTHFDFYPRTRISYVPSRN